MLDLAHGQNIETGETVYVVLTDDGHLVIELMQPLGSQIVTLKPSALGDALRGLLEKEARDAA